MRNILNNAAFIEKNLLYCILYISIIISAGTFLTGCGDTPNNTTSITDTSNSSADSTTNNSNTISTDNNSSNNSNSYNLKDSFITGVDISSIISLEESGVVFYDENNNKCDIFKLLADNGVTCIRVRIFNDPYDENHNSYGGGHNDLATALAIGKRASAYNIPLYIDFHYSDFWADPSKQQVPKTWSNMSLLEKKLAIYDYTVNCLNQFIENNIEIKLVQIGNETNYNFCGETSWDNICTLLSSGIKAVRDIAVSNNLSLETVLHFTNPEIKDNYSTIAAALDQHNVDYDVFATSYYPYWHGTLENLNNILSSISANYNKKVLVAETAYPYTLDDTDYFTNNVNGDNYRDITYDISPAGQRSYIEALAQTLCTIPNSIGFFYWEPAWITVGNSYEENSKKWEKYGSGWATSFSGSYDPDDAGKYYGGSSWDNQALFDFSGKPLPSLSIFKDIR